MARILIAEHNKTTMEYLQTTLAKAGHSVDTADNCLDAWRASSLTDYDVFMLDVVMPGIDTFALAQRALQENPGLQIIFITGFAGVAMDSFSEISYLPAPVTSRPFHLKDIVPRVRYLLGQGGLPQTKQNNMTESRVIYADFARETAMGAQRHQQ